MESFIPCNNLAKVLTYQGRPPTKGPNRAVIRLFVIHSGTVFPAKNSAQAWLAHSIFGVDWRSFAVTEPGGSMACARHTGQPRFAGSAQHG